MGTMSEDAYERIWEIVASIPRGRVATYGQVAELAGIRRGARLVGHALQRAPASLELPWHRVINAQGLIAFPEGHANRRRQLSRLRAEDVALRGGRVDLVRYRWRPGAEEWPEEYLAAERPCG